MTDKAVEKGKARSFCDTSLYTCSIEKSRPSSAPHDNTGNLHPDLKEAAMEVEIRVSHADSNVVAETLEGLAREARAGSLRSFGSGGGGGPSVSVRVTGGNAGGHGGTATFGGASFVTEGHGSGGSSSVSGQGGAGIPEKGSTP